MREPSFRRTPPAPVFAARSEPARSTKFLKNVKQLGQVLGIKKLEKRTYSNKFLLKRKEEKERYMQIPERKHEQHHNDSQHLQLRLYPDSQLSMLVYRIKSWMIDV